MMTKAEVEQAREHARKWEGIAHDGPAAKVVRLSRGYVTDLAATCEALAEALRFQCSDHNDNARCLCKGCKLLAAYDGAKPR